MLAWTHLLTRYFLTTSQTPRYRYRLRIGLLF